MNHYYFVFLRFYLYNNLSSIQNSFTYFLSSSNIVFFIYIIPIILITDNIAYDSNNPKYSTNVNIYVLCINDEKFIKLVKNVIYIPAILLSLILNTIAKNEENQQPLANYVIKVIIIT